MEINWNASRTDSKLIDRIVQRAKGLGLVADPMESTMDVTAVHLNGCPLRLADMLNAPDFDFIHDFSGIARHINRNTAQLENYFLPRFSNC